MRVVDAVVTLNGIRFQRIVGDSADLAPYWTFSRTGHWASEVRFDRTDGTVFEWQMLAFALDRIVDGGA